VLKKVLEYLKFYASAVTHYQVHSPALFALVQDVLEDRRWFYAYRDVEGLRRMMWRSTGSKDPCGICQGRRLFLTANHFQPKKIMHWGTGLGIASAYLYSGARDADFLGLEQDPEKAKVARLNLDWLGLSKKAEVLEGDAALAWAKAQQGFGAPDLVLLNGVDSDALRWFELSLRAAKPSTVFVFTGLHRTAAGRNALRALREHPDITASVDFFDATVFFIDPAFKGKQHLSVVPYRLKPWKFY
jgi:predicted O-methyltransferase YrrM